MIELEIKEYCNDCLEFEPEVERPTRVCYSNGEAKLGPTIVRCANHRRCEAMRRYLVKQMEKGEKNG